MRNDNSFLKERGAGVFLPLSSLPSHYPVGDLGENAYRFVDFLKSCGQSFWQILPIYEIDRGGYGSPYQAISTFAGNTLYISLEKLAQEGLIKESDLPEPFCSNEVDYQKAYEIKEKTLKQVYENFINRANLRKREKKEFEEFCEKENYWLSDFSLFSVLFKNLNKSWIEWDEDIRQRQNLALQKIKRKLASRIEEEKFKQFLFYKQWQNLKEYANKNGIKIIGDIPIYVEHNSCDVWVRRELFKLDKNGFPLVVAGVPPDYFSATGQRWGNPIYNWDKLKRTNFSWWIKRLEKAFSLFDLVRIDHFRGLVAYWEIPASEDTAIKGKWVKVPVYDLFDALFDAFGNLNIIAEDLGVITEDVVEVMRKYNFAGMKVLQFAFGEDMPKNPYIPHNLDRECVLYTGTHDNNTLKGWFKEEASDIERRNLSRYLGRAPQQENINWHLIRLAYSSVAGLVIVPLPDIIGLGSEARINKPSTREGNWKWRFNFSQISEEDKERLREFTKIYGRERNS